VSEVEVRVKAAAKLLRKAADKVSDAKLKEMLINTADTLERLDVDVEVAKDHIRRVTVDDIVKEIRWWIWRKVEEGPKREGSESKSELDILLEDLEKRINESLNDFERLIKAIEKGCRFI